MAECAANIETVQRMVERLERIDEERLTKIQADQDAIGAIRFIQDLLE